MPYCSDCGSKIESSESFCPNCGQQQQPEVSVTPSRQVPARKSGIRWAALVFGAVMVISVFLPWASVDFGFGFRETAAGTAGNWGIFSLIMGFICVAVAFLPMPRIRGMAHVGAGALAAIGIAGYWGGVEGALGLAAGFGMLELSPGVGLYLCLVAAVAVIVIGVVELRQKGMPSA